MTNEPVEQNQPSTYNTELRHRFDYHPPQTASAVKAHETVRSQCLELATVVEMLVPPGREQSLAIKKIEEAMMWANAGIARGGGPR